MQIAISNCFLCHWIIRGLHKFSYSTVYGGKPNINLCLGKYKNAQITWDNYPGSPIFEYVFYTRELYTLGKGEGWKRIFFSWLSCIFKGINRGLKRTWGRNSNIFCNFILVLSLYYTWEYRIVKDYILWQSCSIKLLICSSSQAVPKSSESSYQC